VANPARNLVRAGLDWISENGRILDLPEPELKSVTRLLQICCDVCCQPFWPIGSGCARGFLGALDTAWMVRSWASGKMTPLEVIAERESIYQLLSQTTPENLNKSFAQHTIDPNTR